MFSDIGDFLLFSKVTELVSIRLMDVDDLNEGISPGQSIKSPDLMHFVIGLSFDYERKLLFYSDVERGDVIAADFTGTSFHKVVEGKATLKPNARNNIKQALLMQAGKWYVVSLIFCFS